jgi:hypothetical protein
LAFVSPTHAQSDTTPEPTKPPAEERATPTATLTAVTVITESAPLADPAITAPNAVITATGETESATTNSAASAAAGTQGPLEGTIIANRSAVDIRFFVDGETYTVGGGRSLGLSLQRPSTVLNLFSCPGASADDALGCFWDPYLLRQDGFYEVTDAAPAGTPATLVLAEAGAVPSDKVWVQNRSGATEVIVVNDQTVELPAGALQEFAVTPELPVIVYLRSCLTAGEEVVCEWSPAGVEPGFYYALVKKDVASGDPLVQQTAVAIESVVAGDTLVIARAPEGVCRLRVPTLNVRGGPDLSFPIVAKIRGSTEEPGAVVVVGVDPTGQWYLVDEKVAPEGWITTSAEFSICTGELAQLPTIGELLPTPTPNTTIVEAVPEAAPVVVEEQGAAEPAPPAGADAVDVPAEAASEPLAEEVATEEAPAPDPGAIPDGQARIVVNNGFDQILRFTMDQKFRVGTDNLSGAGDLAPGDSITVMVFPGQVAFSASSAWRGLSGNADFILEEKQERVLWLYFIPDPDGSGRWNLQY